MKKCFYCQRPVHIIDDGFCYVIEEDEQLTYSHNECAEMTDGFNFIDFWPLTDIIKEVDKNISKRQFYGT